VAGPHESLCGSTHPGAGRIDETARRLSHEEYAAAAQLAAEGHDVRSLREGRGRGRVADLEACGSKVEVKSFLPLEERKGRVPNARSVLNKLLNAGGQAGSVFVNAEGSGLTASAARRGLAMYAAHPRGGELGRIRVMADDFDLTWIRQAARHLGVGSGLRGGPAARPPELGLGG
jgi:hypothetical protein